MKQVLSVLLALALLLPLAACGKKPADPETPASDPSVTAGADENPALETEAPETEAKLLPDISDTTYGGQDLRFLSREITDAVVRYYSEVASDEMNGEAMNDATFERTQRLETTWDIKIVNDTNSDVGQTFSKTYRAGEQDWDVIIPGFGDAITLMQQGLTVNLYDVEYIDVSKPWWDGAVAESMEIGKKLYGAIGSINTWTDSHTYGTTFNKDLAKDYEVDPYTMVREGKWTLDNMYAIAQNVTTDRDGNGEWNQNDRYGISGTNYGFNLHMIASGISVFEKDEDGYPQLNITEKFYNAAEKICAIMTSGNYMKAEDLTGKVDDIWDKGLRDNFRTGGSLFLVNGIEEIIIYRDLDVDIGLLPLPKYDEAQDRFYHPFSTYWASIILVPRNSVTTEFTGAMLEAMNADAFYSTSVTYYDVLLAGKAMRDPDSVEMLNIIRSSRVQDTELVYSFLGLSNTYTSLLNAGSVDTLASSIQRNQKMAEKQIEKFIKQYQD
ncbi:MAG: extracellular solute-binding protein [Clostridiales bacterium]|nr:extracellular solute-binding protein [Clostridiales bacterium]